MADDFEGKGTQLDSPASNAAAVTPSDSADLDSVPRGFYLGGDGDVSVVMLGGQTVTFTAMPAGVIHPLRVTRIRATGTTATGIVAVW